MFSLPNVIIFGVLMFFAYRLYKAERRKFERRLALKEAERRTGAKGTLVWDAARKVYRVENKPPK